MPIIGIQMQGGQGDKNCDGAELNDDDDVIKTRALFHAHHQQDGQQPNDGKGR